MNNLDLALFKNFAVTHGMRLQFRLESFNALNHTQFSGVSTNLAVEQLRRRDVGAPGPHQSAGPEAAVLTAELVGRSTRTRTLLRPGSDSGGPARTTRDAARMTIACGRLVWLALSRSRRALRGAGRVDARQQPDPAVLQQHAREGERALAEGRYADAQKAYETLRQLSPGTAEVHARLGLIYFQQGKFADAIAPLREALRLKPGLPKVDALLAMSLSELGRYDEALPAVTKAFSQSADPVLRRMAGLHLQRIYTGLGRDRDAVDVALRLSRLYPDDPEVLYHSGRLFANFAYLQTMKLAAVAPDSVWLHQAAGEANESQGLYDAALARVPAGARGRAAPPGHPFPHRPRPARTRERRRAPSASDAVEARRAFEEELALDPTNANAAYELGGDAAQGRRARAGAQAASSRR